MQLVLTPELVLEAYRHGLFPMAHHAQSPFVQWVCPQERGQLSITDIHIPKRLLKTLRQAPYKIRVNTAFSDVVAMCAQSASDRPETWINEQIASVYTLLHHQGHAQSI
ncbi:MAG: leucyl/phenylalanyl-tRNA--protein transferase, partial [Alphaproteobacteria bacterium]